MDYADLQNSANWDLAYSVNKEAEKVGGFSVKRIPDIVLPTYVNSKIIATYTDSDAAPLSWKTSGYVQKEISIGITVGNNQNTKFEFSRKIPLRKAASFSLPGYGENYKLVFSPHKWFLDISLSVWVYTGDLSDDLIQQLELVRIDLLRVEKKLDILLRGSI